MNVAKYKKEASHGGLMPVDFTGWRRDFRENWSESPLFATLQAVWCIYLALWLTVTSRVEIGKNVYDREWDVLVILDACRVDALREVAPEYDFLDADEIDSIWTVGSGSLEFMCKTFTYEYEDEVNDTLYMAANGYINRAFADHLYAPSVSVPFGFPKENHVHAEDFHELTNLAKTRRVDTLRNVPPSNMTDAAIGAGRRSDAGRKIFHYSQPHTPYLADAIAEDRPVTDTEHTPWPAIRNGDIDDEDAYEMYLDNLRLVLDNVAVLLENIDADTVAISADHGEAFGDWGIHGHPTGFPFPPVKKVPWITTTATDTGEYAHTEIEGEANNCATLDEEVVQEQLADLGYL